MNSDVVTVLSCIGAVAVSLIGGTWILTWKLSDQRTETDEEIERTKKDLEEKFVCKNVCSVLHAQTKGDVERIERMVEKKFDGINETLNKLFELVRENRK